MLSTFAFRCQVLQDGRCEDPRRGQRHSPDHHHAYPVTSWALDPRTRSRRVRERGHQELPSRGQIRTKAKIKKAKKALATTLNSSLPWMCSSPASCFGHLTWPSPKSSTSAHALRFGVSTSASTPLLCPSGRKESKCHRSTTSRTSA